MGSFECGIGGKLDPHPPMALAYKRPARYFSIPDEERERRVRCNDDLCVIDGREFLIRGVQQIPIKDSDESFDWGVWALVERRDYVRYVDAWRHDNEGDVSAFLGLLSGGLHDYADSDALEVSITLGGSGKRPLFTVRSMEHLLGADQREGITWEKAHSFIRS